MKKQTAVEWLIEQLKERGYAGEFPPHILFEQAKEMHKEETEANYEDGYSQGYKRALDYMMMSIKNAIETRKP